MTDADAARMQAENARLRRLVDAYRREHATSPWNPYRTDDGCCCSHCQVALVRRMTPK